MGIFLSILFLLIALLLLFWQTSNIYSILAGAPYVSVDLAAMRQALKLANFKKGEIFYELGCGAGNVLLEAQKYGIQVVGYEVSPWYFLLAKLRTLRYKNIKIVYKDVRQVDLGPADVIYCYLLPELLEQLTVQFGRAIKLKKRIISISFAVPGLKPKSITVFQKHKIFIY